MHSHQMRKYDISESTIQALYYDILCNKVIIRACVMDSEMPYFLVWSLLSDIILCIYTAAVKLTQWTTYI